METTRFDTPDQAKRCIGKELTPEFLDALDYLFPERTPELADPIDQIRYASGQRSVIRFLRGLTNGLQE